MRMSPLASKTTSTLLSVWLVRPSTRTSLMDTFGWRAGAGVATRKARARANADAKAEDRPGARTGGTERIAGSLLNERSRRTVSCFVAAGATGLGRTAREAVG